MWIAHPRRPSCRRLPSPCARTSRPSGCAASTQPGAFVPCVCLCLSPIASHQVERGMLSGRCLYRPGGPHARTGRGPADSSQVRRPSVHTLLDRARLFLPPMPPGEQHSTGPWPSARHSLPNRLSQTPRWCRPRQVRRRRFAGKSADSPCRRFAASFVCHAPRATRPVGATRAGPSSCGPVRSNPENRCCRLFCRNSKTETSDSPS